MMGFGMGFGWIFSLLFIGLAIWAVVEIFRKNKDVMSPKIEEPVEILKRRYANGEISKDEYNRMKNDLI